jgi:hypothetical protein
MSLNDLQSSRFTSLICWFDEEQETDFNPLWQAAIPRPSGQPLAGFVPNATY